tara:strand:+ start:145 stop:537 length:393 start_codon:yes stop_codon:yes gene_type:complete
MTSQTAYVLTEGEYSDYHILGVYSTKKLAEEAKSLWPYSDVESFPFDEIPEHPPGMYFWHGRADTNIGDQKTTQQVCKAPPGEANEQGTEVSYGNRLRFRVNFWATNKDHALQILHDKYHQHMAQKAELV